jgi:chemotaxis protein MotB
MAKKKKCPEFENHERWLVAYADMMTLLFALFVVLYAIANADMAKMKKVSISVQKAFGIESNTEGPEGQPKGNQLDEGIFKKIKGNTNRDSFLKRMSPEVTALITVDFKKLDQEISDRLYGRKFFAEQNPQVLKERVVFLNQDSDGLRVSLLSKKFFKPSSTQLVPEAKETLDKVAEAVKAMRRIVRIEGHTDNLPFNLDGMTNWELSTGRAAAVVRYLIDAHRFDPAMIYAAGYADTRPIASNDTPESRSMNRRVDIKILYDNNTDEIPADAPALEDGKTDDQKSEDSPANETR